MNRKIKICIFSFIAFVMTIVGYGGTSKALADDSESEVSAVYDIKNGDPIAVSKNQWDEYQEVQDWEDEPDVPSTYLKKAVDISERRACMGGWAYSATKQGYAFYNIVEGTHYLNRTKDNVTITSTFTGTHSKSSTASGKLGGGWKPVSAEVGYNADRTVSWSKSDSVKITVRPKYEGWNDYGTKRDKWYGTYYYLSNSCVQSKNVQLTVYIPKVKAVVAHTKHL